jgi:hypothetical protein
LFEHDLFRKPVPTFRDHALGVTVAEAALGTSVPSFPFRFRRAAIRAAGGHRIPEFSADF